MPPLDPDWHPAASYFIVLAGMAVTVWLATRGTRKKVEETRGDVAAIKEQTNNSHSTNLREDVDRFGATSQRAMESAHRTERLAEDLVKSLRAVEHSLDRRTDLQSKAIDELADDTMPNVVAQALAAHVRIYHPTEKP